MMKLITCFIIVFFASTMLYIFFYFNLWMDEQNDNKSFFQEIKEDIFRKEVK